MALNSHTIQRALIERVFPKGVAELNVNSNKVKLRNYSNVASSKTLFGSDEEYSEWIERLMNEKLENKFIKIVDRVSDSIEEIEVSLEEAFLIRKYYAVTWIRMNLRNIEDSEKEKIKKMIEEWTVDNYHDKYMPPYFKDDFIFQFFINESTIKFIRHNGYSFINDRDLFISIPFDKQHTDYEYLTETLNIRMPGFIAPFSEKISIVFMHNFFTYGILHMALHKIAPKLKLNISHNGVPNLLMNDARVKDEKGNVTNSFQVKTIDDFSGLPIDLIKDWSSRDPKKCKYIYKVHNWGSDWIIVQAHAFNEYETYMRLENIDINHSYIFQRDESFKTFLSNMVNIVNYVEHNRPGDINFWSSDNSKKLKHKIWEMLSPTSIELMKKMIKIIQESGI